MTECLWATNSLLTNTPVGSCYWPQTAYEVPHSATEHQLVTTELEIQAHSTLNRTRTTSLSQSTSIGACVWGSTDFCVYCWPPSYRTSSHEFGPSIRVSTQEGNTQMQPHNLLHRIFSQYTTFVFNQRKIREALLRRQLSGIWNTTVWPPCYFFIPSEMLSSLSNDSNHSSVMPWRGGFLVDISYKYQPLVCMCVCVCVRAHIGDLVSFT